nr:pentapeptide repeat-containing protein [Streptomyces sp. V1I6]
MKAAWSACHWAVSRVTVAGDSPAELVGADLTGAYLSWADLTEANLGEALLTAVDLQEARLREANLSDAWLPAAHLHKADLTQATLSGARLTAESWGGRQLLSAWEAACRINRRPSLPLTPAMWASVLLRDDQRLDAHFAASMRADSGFAKEETTAQRRRLLMTARARLYQARVPRPAPSEGQPCATAQVGYPLSGGVRTHHSDKGCADRRRLVESRRNRRGPHPVQPCGREGTDHRATPPGQNRLRKLLGGPGESGVALKPLAHRWLRWSGRPALRDALAAD